MLSTFVIRLMVPALVFTMSAAVEKSPACADLQRSSLEAIEQAPPDASAISKSPSLIQALAQRTAESIEESKRKKVLVFDFVGPDISSTWNLTRPSAKKRPLPPPSKAVTMLGRGLARQFDATLAQLLSNVEVRSWNQLYETLVPNNFMPSLVEDPTTALWATNAARFDLFVWGDLERATDDQLNLRVLCFRVRDGRPIESLRVPISLSSGAEKLVSIVAEETMHASYPLGGKNGIAFPQCRSCPQAQFPEAAIGKVNEGTVELEVIVTTGGLAKDIKVVRGLPYGFTEKAIEAVHHWHFQPARGPDGKPTPVRLIIEITFHLG